jgi:hypothetical protein
MVIHIISHIKPIQSLFQELLKIFASIGAIQMRKKENMYAHIVLLYVCCFA